jgi:hypothetical protein
MGCMCEYVIAHLMFLYIYYKILREGVGVIDRQIKKG